MNVDITLSDATHFKNMPPSLSIFIINAIKISVQIYK